MNRNKLFIEELLDLVPELRSVYDKHLENNGSLLQHVFMGDATRFIIAEASKSQNEILLQKLLNYLEAGLKQGEEVEELIVVSFVENLIDEKIALQVLKPLMGSNLRTQVETICE